METASESYDEMKLLRVLLRLKDGSFFIKQFSHKSLWNEIDLLATKEKYILSVLLCCIWQVFSLHSDSDHDDWKLEKRCFYVH